MYTYCIQFGYTGYQVGKPVMITTNIKNSQLAAAKEAEDIEKSRIFGRLLENAVAYTLKGKDYRFESARRAINCELGRQE